MNKSLSTTAVLLITIVLIMDVAPCRAKDERYEDVDEIIEGFNKDESVGDALEDRMQGSEQDTVEEAKSPQTEDDLLEGFEDEAPAGKPPPPQKEATSWSLDGEFAVTTTYNVSPDATAPWRGFSMLRSELELALKNRFSETWQGQVSARGFYDAIFAIRGRDRYTSQVLDDYESELELEDTYIQGRLTKNLDTKIGRQIVVWGTLDNLRVTDVLNPLDLRVPGLTDIDDLRLPVTMIKFDYYFGNWDLSVIAIPEVRFSKLPVFGSDFFPFPTPRPPEDKPDDGFENMQYAAALTGVFSGWDIGFYGADIYADQTYAVLTSPGPPEQFVRKHARINMLGSAANLAVGNWLMKAEAAWFNGLRYTNTPGITYSRLDLGGGIEYTGFTEATISLEAANRHIFDYSPSLKQPPDEVRQNEFQWSFRIMKDFLNDTLTVMLLASTFGIKADDGAFERLEAEYDITDAVSIRGGLVFYQSGDKGLFQDVDANDRLFMVLTFNF